MTLTFPGAVRQDSLEDFIREPDWWLREKGHKNADDQRIMEIIGDLIEAKKPEDLT